jgi:hypothetical protein
MNMSNGKGDRDRTSDFKRYRKNMERIFKNKKKKGKK